MLQFRYRAVDGGPGDRALGSDIYDLSLPLRVALQRSGDLWTVQYSTDSGTTWRSPAGGSVTLDLGQNPLLGLDVVSYDAEVPLTAELDNFSICPWVP